MQIIQRDVPQAAFESLKKSQHPVLARIYAARGIDQASQLEHGLNNLTPFSAMKGVDEAVELLVQALQQQQRILIVGDFDADGATSTTVAVRGLRMLGAKHVDYLVPNRFEFGYGLSPEIVAVAAQRQPELLITVDNGISSIDGVAAAKAAGIKVLVTDHHLPGEKLPDADAIVNPNQPGDKFPSRCLAGVGVIFYVLLALRARLRELEWFQKQGSKEPNLALLLDLVGLGTIADLVPLDKLNRILAAQGVARIRKGQCVPGITALLEVAKRQAHNLSTSDLGFVLGPRLNAAGRLEDMSIGIECLLTDDPARAEALAQQLDKLNRERRSIEEGMKEQAFAIVEQNWSDTDQSELPYGLCLFDAEWHQGVIGILASRIKEKLHRPVIAFACGDAGEIKGSARSIPGLHIRDALDEVAASHPEMLKKFGGHAMAAGLSIAQTHFEKFSEAFDQVVRKHLNAEALQAVLHSDGTLSERDIDLQLAEQLRYGGPWGQAFPEPLFDGEFQLISRRIVGEKHLKMVLSPMGSELAIDAIAFFQTDDQWPAQVERLKLAYKLDVNEFRGRRTVQFLVDYVEPVT